MDAPAVRCLAGDPAVAATALGVPHPYEEGMAEAWIATHGHRFRCGEEACSAVVLRKSGELIGAVTLRLVSAERRAELGYWIGRPWWGRGYATEAACRLVRYGFERLGLERVDAQHLSHNAASGRVMEKIGMTCLGPGPRRLDRNGRAVATTRWTLSLGVVGAGSRSRSAP
jgi:RimJ/RimL family protein N-acetyltransferase